MFFKTKPIARDADTILQKIEKIEEELTRYFNTNKGPFKWSKQQERIKYLMALKDALNWTINRAWIS